MKMINSAPGRIFSPGNISMVINSGQNTIPCMEFSYMNSFGQNYMDGNFNFMHENEKFMHEIFIPRFFHA